jgi:hypothetical protein
MATKTNQAARTRHQASPTAYYQRAGFRPQYQFTDGTKSVSASLRRGWKNAVADAYESVLALATDPSFDAEIVEELELVRCELRSHIRSVRRESWAGARQTESAFIAMRDDVTAALKEVRSQASARRRELDAIIATGVSAIGFDAWQAALDERHPTDS